MANTHSTLTSLFSDIADAIRAKTGSSATIVADDFPTAIANIPTGGSANIQALSVTTNGTYTASGNVDGYSPVTVNVSGGGGSSGGVKFIDYDGTVLHTYSAAEFAALTAMPANPTHTGLTSQGWNWTLSDAKAQVTAMGSCDIGQMYVTDDGKTRVYISLNDSLKLSPYLGFCPNGTVVIDWGDNTTTDTLTGTSLSSLKRVQHTYASTGDYVITLTVTSGTFAISGDTSYGSYLLRRDTANKPQGSFLSSIQKIELGGNVSLGNCAFFYCYSLQSVTMPSSLTSIGTRAFQECLSLQSITIPSGVTSASQYMCYYSYSLESISIPKSITSFNNYAFGYCFALESIAIPSGVTTIGTTVFNYCNSLTSITLPSGLTSIGNNAFAYCTSITNVDIPSGVTTIGASAFAYCYALQSITIPSSVTSIGNSAFQTCYSLERISELNGVTSFGTNVFSSCRSLTSITLPSGLTSIGKTFLNYCVSLTSIEIPNGVTTIGESAFAYCNSLQSITIPSSVTSIGNSALSYCYSLQSITIPSSVTSIEAKAFYYTYPIEYHFLPTTPPTLANTDAFTGILTDCKIYVPAASLTAYQEATNWSTYASYMVGE